MLKGAHFIQDTSQGPNITAEERKMGTTGGDNAEMNRRGKISGSSFTSYHRGSNRQRKGFSFISHGRTKHWTEGCPAA